MAGPSIITALAVFYLYVRWVNPGFEDRLWPLAVFSIPVLVIIFLFGLVRVLSKILTPQKYRNPDILFGSLYFVFGLINCLFYSCFHTLFDILSGIIFLVLGTILLLKTR